MWKIWYLTKCLLQNQFLTNYEEVIAKNRFSSFSTFWNFCPYIFDRLLWIIYNVDHWPHAQMPLPERVVKALRYNTFTNTEAQSHWSVRPNKKDDLPFFSAKIEHQCQSEPMKPCKSRLWAYFWGIENKCDEMTSSETKRRGDVFTKQKCTRCAINFNMFSFGTWGLWRRYDMFDK